MMTKTASLGFVVCRFCLHATRPTFMRVAVFASLAACSHTGQKRRVPSHAQPDTQAIVTPSHAQPDTQAIVTPSHAQPDTQAIVTPSHAQPDTLAPATRSLHAGDRSTSTASVLGRRALALARELMSIPRTLGEPRERSVQRLRQLLQREGAETVTVLRHHVDDVRSGHRFELASLFASVRKHAPRQFVLASHYDARPWADEDPDASQRSLPVHGANDGTSGVAVLIALLPRLVHELPQDVGFTLILFDGEELGRPGDDLESNYCHGSREFAKRVRAGEPWLPPSVAFGIVLDMVGDRDLQLPIEPASLRAHPRLVEHVWQTARSLGHVQFQHRTGREILDDHVFLSRAGVPSILLIDHEYAHWHTRRDTLDKLSVQSLGTVAEVVWRSLHALAHADDTHHVRPWSTPARRR